MIRISSILALLALATLCGCSAKVVPIHVTVLTHHCGKGGADPVEGVDHYKAQISGPGMEPIVKIFAAGAAVRFEEIPAGPGRVLALTGYTGDPVAQGVVRAYGQSVPFEVPASTGDGKTVEVVVVLKLAGGFAPVPVVAEPERCASLLVPRAAHTATLLADGRVLFTGGFNVPAEITDPDAGNTEANWRFLSDAEIFDPVTGTSKAVAKMAASNLVPDGFESPTAFHTASLLPDGTVLVVGGEVAKGGVPEARANTMLYDPAHDSWTEGILSAPELDFSDGGINAIARSRHVAVSDKAGRVMVLGGIRYTETGSTKTAYETLWYEPRTGGGTFHPVLGADQLPLELPRAGTSAAPVLGGKYLAAVGGELPGGGLSDPAVVFFQFDDGSHTYRYFRSEGSAQGVALRAEGAVAPLGTDGRHLVVAGGRDAEGGLAGASDVLDTADTAGNLSLPTSAGRTGLCAAALLDGRVLVAGGELVPGKQAAFQAELYEPTASGATVSPTGALQTGRALHTCTVLRDGSVLVAGGISETPGAFQVLDSIEVYTPVPL